MTDASLTRQYLTYMLGMLLQRAGSFVLIPIYTSALSTADYGALELLSNFVGLASLFVVLGVPGAVNKCFHRDCDGDAERRDLVGTSVLFTVPMALVIVAVALLFDRRLAVLVFQREDWAPYVRLALVCLALMQTSMIPMELLRTLGRAKQYVAFSVVQMVVQISLSVALLLIWKLGVVAVLTANVAGYAAIQLGSLWFLLGNCRLTFSWRHLKSLAAFGLLLIPISACGWIVNVSDRFFLQRLASDAEVGLYALGYKFGMLVELVLVLPFQKAWNPYYFSVADKPEGRTVFGRVLTYYVALIGLGVGLLSACGEPLIRVLAHPDYYAAASVIPMIALSYGLSGLVMCLSTGLIVTHKTRIVALVAVIGAAVNTALNIVLIGPMGMMGAAISTLATFAVTFGLTCWAVTRWYPVPVELKRLAKVVASAAGLCLLAFGLQIESPQLELLARASVVLTLPLLLFVVRFFSEEELHTIKAVVARVGAVAGFSGAQ